MEFFIINIKNISEDMVLEVKTRFPNRYKKAISFDDEKERLKSLGGTFLLSRAYPSLLEEKLCYSQTGKPFCSKGEFNISHDGDFVVLVKDDSPIGIDILKIGSKDTTVKISNDKECAWMKENEIANYHSLWSKKESFMKLWAYSLPKDLTLIDVSPFIEGNSLFENGLSTYCSTIRFGDYVISACSFKEIKTINLIEIK